MQKILAAVDKNRDRILAAERYIWAHPETGYREVETTRYLAGAFEELGYTLTYAEGITGFYTVLDTGRPGPEILVLGELDSLICPDHPDADPTTGAVHCCGHNAQCAALLGIAAALKEPGVLDGMCGRIRLCAVPAEEHLEVEYRRSLKEAGKISYYGGKAEFLSRGYFDDVDIALMVHTSLRTAILDGGVGNVVKRITYKGKAAHAGGAPWDGCNALYAANCGLNAINAIRETFAERDIIRVHPIVTHGGDAVNAIPGRVVLESYVRGSNFEAIQKANAKVNRALTGAAYSLGANIEIVDIPGYAPLKNDPGMQSVASDAYKAAFGEELPVTHTMSSGSTDMGDLSQLMPVVHPFMKGQSGTSHGSDFRIADPEMACIGSAKWQLAMLSLLLSDGAVRAESILASFTPPFAAKEDYLAYLDSCNVSGDRIEYREDGSAVLR